MSMNNVLTPLPVSCQVGYNAYIIMLQQLLQADCLILLPDAAALDAAQQGSRRLPTAASVGMPYQL